MTIGALQQKLYDHAAKLKNTLKAFSDKISQNSLYTVSIRKATTVVLSVNVKTV